jgi:FkbM family methyltransferase
VKTIFDLGMHEGWDAEYYLKKGFRVIGVEASPQFFPTVRARLSAWLDRGQLVLVEAALAEQSAAAVPFYVRFDKNCWSGLFRHVAERDGIASTPINVASITISELFRRFGVPHFLKCDLEGAEALVLQQIAREAIKPQFIAIEADPRAEDLVDRLVAAGYVRFQIINQGYLRLLTPPNPPREGHYVDQQFHSKMSGLFGEELEPKHWVNEAELRHRLKLRQRLIAGDVDPLRRLVLKKYGKWTRRTWLIDSGWIDIHARLDG